MGKARPDDDEEDLAAYGVAQESEEELRLIEKNKPRFGEVRDKFKKSAKGPAQALLVMPTNLLVRTGGATFVAGIGIIVYGIWNWIFTNAPASSEQVADYITTAMLGFGVSMWAVITILGASQAQNLESYAWAFVGGVFGLFPTLAPGIFTLIALRDPRVVAGFREAEGGDIDDAEEPDGGKPDGEDDEDDEEEEERPRRRRK